MEPNQEEHAGTDPLLEEQAGKGYGAGKPEEAEPLEDAPSPDDE